MTAATIATVSLLVLEPMVGEIHPFTTYIFAITFTSWYCGFGPAVLCLLSGLVASAYFFLYPIWSVQIHGIDRQVGALLYLFVGMSSIFLTESLRRANAKSLAVSQDLIRQQDELSKEIERRQAVQAEHMQLLRHVVSLQEEERRRLSRELHDHCGQELTALRIGISLIEEAVKCKSLDAVATHFEDVKSLLNKLSTEIHTLAFELRPYALDDLGIRTAMEGYIANWSKRTGIEVDFECRLKSEHFSSEISTAIYRVFQESLNNVFKHAKAERVSVILESDGTQLTLIVEDNGMGFEQRDSDTQKMNSTRLQASPQLGVLGMKERMESIGGSLELESSENGGTTVFAKVHNLTKAL